MATVIQIKRHFLFAHKDVSASLIPDMAVELATCEDRTVAKPESMGELGVFLSGQTGSTELLAQMTRGHDCIVTIPTLQTAEPMTGSFRPSCYVMLRIWALSASRYLIPVSTRFVLMGIGLPDITIYPALLQFNAVRLPACR